LKKLFAFISIVCLSLALFSCGKAQDSSAQASPTAEAVIDAATSPVSDATVESVSAAASEQALTGSGEAKGIQILP
jgi:hypothetical protein